MHCVRERGTWVWFKQAQLAKLYKNGKQDWRGIFKHPVYVNPDLIRFRVGGYFHQGYSPKYSNQLTSEVQLKITQMPGITGWVVTHTLYDPNDPITFRPCIMFASAAEALLFKLSY